MEILRGYRIIRKLATGGTSALFLAEQRSLGRKVVLKKLHPHFGEEARLVKVFNREAEALSKLSHANIVRIIDYGEFEQMPTLIMEYIEGQDLGRLLRQVKKLPLVMVSYILREVSKALSYAHSKGIIHRDIKPSNILLSDDGEVKLSDFGLARLLAAGSVTLTEATVGTPIYMSPEQARGEKVGPASDIFSLGIVGYEALTGVNPFEAKSMAEVFSKVIQTSPPLLSAYQPGIAKSVCQFFERALKNSQRERISSAKDFEIELMAAVKKAQIKFEPEEIKSSLKELVTQEKEEIEVETKASSAKKKRRYCILALAVVSLLLVWYSVWLNKFPTRIPELKLSQEHRIKRVSLPAKSPKTTGEKKVAPPVVKKVKKEQRKPKVLEKGLLSLSVPAEAEVWLNEQYQGRTPLKAPLSLQPGEYKLRVTKLGFEPFEKIVTVKSKEHQVVEVSLKQQFGYLRVIVFPWADVYINGEKKAQTPLAEPIKLPVGKHRLLLISSELYENYETEVEIKPDEIVKIEVELKRKK